MEEGNSDIFVDREAGFAERLFADVDRPDSPVNIVIGAPAFHCRLEFLAREHHGTDARRGRRRPGDHPDVRARRAPERLEHEPEASSGKRGGTTEDSVDLPELETLHIFGLRANYMQTFRDLLEKEGMRVERETVELPVTWNLGKKSNLKLIRIQGDRKFERSEERPILPNPDESGRPVVTLDLYSRLQSLASGEAPSGPPQQKHSVKLMPQHTAFFDAMRVYDRLLRRKQQNGWHNLVIRPETVDRLLRDTGWYGLSMPPERLALTDFRSLKQLEDVAVDLLTEYADRFWRSQRREWESNNFEVVTLDEDDPNNLKAYELSVDAMQSQLIDDLHQLAANVREGDCHRLKLGVILAGAHAYQPLLYAREGCPVTVRPVALDENEKTVVKGLADLAKNGDPCLRSNELYLIRNLTRGRGVSFFDDFGYYPDFIVWLKMRAVSTSFFLIPKD